MLMTHFNIATGPVYYTVLIVRVILYLLAAVSSDPGISLLSIGITIGCLLLYKALSQSSVQEMGDHRVA